MRNYLYYTDSEIRSLLPGGWKPLENGRYIAEKKVFTVKVSDPSRLDWVLEIKLEKAEKLGRIEALREAVLDLLHNRFRSILG